MFPALLLGEITNADIQVAIELFKEDTFDEDTEDNFGDGDAPSRMPPKQEVGDSTKRNFANSLYNRLEEDCQEREEDLAPCKPQVK